MSVIWITVPSGAEERHPMPPDLPTSVHDVVKQLAASWLHGSQEKIMLPDGACYEREQVMGIRGED
jgi:hypothetical protein